MSAITHSITVARAREDVFNFVANLCNDEKWWEPVERTEKITSGAIDVGTQFVQHAKVMFVKVENNLTVMDWNPPESAQFLNESKQLPFLLKYKFDTVDGGTKYTLHAELETKGILSLLNPLTVMTLNKQLESYFEVLKQVLEQEL